MSISRMEARAFAPEQRPQQNRHERLRQPLRLADPIPRATIERWAEREWWARGRGGATALARRVDERGDLRHRLQFRVESLSTEPPRRYQEHDKQGDHDEHQAARGDEHPSDG